MSTKTLKHIAADGPLSKLESRDWTREQYREIWAMARRMIRQRPGSSAGASLCWFYDHCLRRFGYGGHKMARVVGPIVLGRIHVGLAATGTPAELARQGMVKRCVRLEPAPRGGWSWAWTFDPLAAVNLNRGRRVYAARQRRALREACESERVYTRASAYLTTCGRETAHA